MRVVVAVNGIKLSECQYVCAGKRLHAGAYLAGIGGGAVITSVAHFASLLPKFYPVPATNESVSISDG